MKVSHSSVLFTHIILADFRDEFLGLTHGTGRRGKDREGLLIQLANSHTCKELDEDGGRFCLCWEMVTWVQQRQDIKPH